MADNATAAHLMLRDFRTLQADQTLGEAMRALIELQADSELPNALAILDDDGRYVGLLTARLLFKSLLTFWMPGKSVRRDETRLEDQLLDVVQDRSRLKVKDALIRGLPTASPADRLLALIELCCDQRLEFLPVVADGHLLGLVPTTAIFRAAASLALTPEHEGIQGGAGGDPGSAS